MDKIRVSSWRVSFDIGVGSLWGYTVAQGPAFADRLDDVLEADKTERDGVLVRTGLR